MESGSVRGCTSGIFGIYIDRVVAGLVSARCSGAQTVRTTALYIPTKCQIFREADAQEIRPEAVAKN